MPHILRPNSGGSYRRTGLMGNLCHLWRRYRFDAKLTDRRTKHLILNQRMYMYSNVRYSQADKTRIPPQLFPSDHCIHQWQRMLELYSKKPTKIATLKECGFLGGADDQEVMVVGHDLVPHQDAFASWTGHYVAKLLSLSFARVRNQL
jgi:hypothetical protein